MPKLLECCVLVAVLLASLPPPVIAQPHAWVLHRVLTLSGLTPALSVVNLATGRSVTQFNLAGVEFGGGELTPDGQFYLLATSFGVVRVNTATRAVSGLFGPPMNAERVQVSPSGKWFHVITAPPRRYITLAASTGAVLSDRPDASTYFLFSSTGTMRFAVLSDFVARRTVITAYPDAPNAMPIWQKTLEAIPDGVAVSDQDLVYSDATVPSCSMSVREKSAGVSPYVGGMPRLMLERSTLLQGRRRSHHRSAKSRGSISRR